MSFYSCWQPLSDEDRHTALVFGFFRHAPVGLALEPWLSHVLGRPITAKPLRLDSFWPALPSIIEGQTVTIPELVFDAEDARGELKIVIEVKPGSTMHTIDQISREVVDVARDLGAERIALVMVGADLGPPTATADWEARVAADIVSRDLIAEAEVVHSSFALIGEVIATAGETDPAWRVYADDVNAQLTRKGLLGYGGAPMIDDLDGLTLRNGVEIFNRIIASARQFYLQLHQDSRFLASQLQPDLAGEAVRTPRMLRDGRTDQIGQPEANFKTKIILSLYKHPNLGPQSRIFIAFDLLPTHSTDIQILAGRMNYAAGQPHDTRRLTVALPKETTTAATSDIPYLAETTSSRWQYNRRNWQPGHAPEDISWTLRCATRAIDDTEPPHEKA